jgi:hypothetical protein
MDALVADFVSALDDPIVPEATMVNMGITQAWLDAHVDQVVRSLGRLSEGPRDTESQKALFRKTFTNPDSIQPLLRRLFNCPLHFDDYPSVEVVVSLGARQPPGLRNLTGA